LDETKYSENLWKIAEDTGLEPVEAIKAEEAGVEPAQGF
jgi:hypothetical protein